MPELVEINGKWVIVPNNSVKRLIELYGPGFQIDKDRMGHFKFEFSDATVHKREIAILRNAQFTAEEIRVLEVLGQPPASAKFWLLMLPKSSRENLIGDLEEEYWDIVLPEYGLKAARSWYRWHVFYSVCAFVLETVKGIVMFWRTSK